LLKEWQEKGAFKKANPILQAEGLSFFAGDQAAKLNSNGSVKELITAFTRQAQQGDYIALLPYFMMTESRTKILQSWREKMGTGLKVATTMLNGPRYLHSTGQLHKGGPDTGLYILLVSEEDSDLPIPGEKYGFARLHQAQSLGDFRSLSDKGRRVLRISLGKDIDKGLEQLQDSIMKTLQNA
jgi:transaldolase/glucose-6-phosphate isomerase